MNDEEGVSIAISPVQMAAILHIKTVSEGETWSNRLWGGLGLVGGLPNREQLDALIAHLQKYRDKMPM
ncbi:hypothetical protein [Erwinia tasmaniensis]|uniref:hypothetical protein n=1 Tax=Erwinia tasmaniensis TaxID=338565 RepID=UPI003A4E40D2